MRLVLFAAIACLALAACSGGYPRYPGADHQAAAEPPPITVRHEAHLTEYALPDRVLFAIDSAQVLPTARQLVADIAADATRHPDAPLEVNGFTDTTGTGAHNMRLSEARARSVAAVLVENGVAEARIRARGFGETELAVETGNNVSKLDNRRVIVRLLTPG